MLVCDFVSRATAIDPALRAENRTPLSYSKLADLVSATTAFLNGRGLDATARVAMVLSNGPEAAAAFLAVSAAATAAPLNPNLKAAELEFLLQDLRAAALVTTPEHETACRLARQLGIDVLMLRTRVDDPAGWFELDAPAAAARPPALQRPSPDSVALILHTSGTTARPKMVGLSHRNLHASAATIAGSLGLSAVDSCLNIMPLFHIHGLAAGVLASLASGGSVFCSPGFNAHRFFPWLSESRATWYTAVPSMHQAILGRARVNAGALAAHTLRFVRSCSSPLPLHAWEGLEEVFHVPVVSAYGMTEAAHQISATPLPYPASKRGTVGRATGTDIAVMDDDGRLLAAGCAGEVVIRGHSVIRAYLENPEADVQAFRNGWFRTGDQGRIDDDGYVTLTGRLKEIINTGGEKVAPLEVDAVLMEHPAVAQAVTFGVPDASLGERVAAAVVLHGGVNVTPDTLRAFASERLAKFKVPRVILPLPAIPTGPTGKFQRSTLGQQLGLVDTDVRTSGRQSDRTTG